MTDADRFHIPPSECSFCGPQFLGTCPHRPSMGVKQLGEGMSPVEAAKQPLMAMSVIDLKPLISFFATELQRARDQLAVERSATSSAREALAACEERLRQSRMAAEEGMREHDRMQREIEHARCDAKDARQMLMDERERFKRDVALAANSSPMLVPGSAAAVIEAYRLLSGYEPVFGANGQWDDGALPTDPNYDAERALLVWLNKNARDGSRT